MLLLSFGGIYPLIAQHKAVKVGVYYTLLELTFNQIGTFSVIQELKKVSPEIMKERLQMRRMMIYKRNRINHIL